MKKNTFVTKEQVEEIVKTYQHHFIYMTKRELEKMLEDLIRHFHGIKVLKNILQLRLSLIHIS